jgi:23S rRNA (pseudouridine1915-N3)-methyltransferase
MQIEILCPEIKKLTMASEAVKRFLPRLKKFTPAVLQEFKTEKNGDAPFKILKESSEILKKIDDKDFLIALDEKGENYSTRELASKVELVQLEQGYKKIVFLIGGPYGLSNEIKQRANLKISLSLLTFNSEIAIVVLMEQVYRIYSVIVGHPYHND